MRITLATSKGGSGKSTSAVHLALGLARTGRVLLVDADARSSTVTDWSAVAAALHEAGEGPPWPAEVTVYDAARFPDLDRRVRDLADAYSHVVIDTGGDDDRITAKALMVAGELVVPVGTSLTDLRRVPATVEVAERVADTHPVTMRCLLTRVRSGTRSALEAREALEANGWPVMDATVALRERYAQALGTVPTELGDYEDVLAELLAPAEPAETAVRSS